MAVVNSEPNSGPFSSAAPSLLDVNLPQEVIDNIVRFVSYRPTCAHPQSFVAPSDVLALLNAAEELCIATRKHFDAVSLLTMRWRRRAASRELDTNPPGLLLHEPELLAPLLEGLGAGLRRLSMDNVCDLKRSWMDAVVKNAVNLTELSLHNVDTRFPLMEVLTACTALQRLTLKSEECSSDQHIFLVSHYAPRLRALALYNANPMGCIAGIWKRLEALEDLTIFTARYMFHRGNLFLGIAHPNSKVRELELGKLRAVDFLRVAALCEKFGPRLRLLKLKLHGNTHAQGDILMGFERIRATCPEAAVHLACSGMSYHAVISAFRGLKDALVNVELNVMSRPAAIHIGDDVALCTNLRCLTLRVMEGDADEFLESLLARIGRQLRELSLTVYSQQRPRTLTVEVPEYFGALVRHTGNLERLIVDELEPIALLGPVAQANPHLKRTIITINNNMVAASVEHSFIERWVMSLVDSFLANCPRLVDFVIDNPQSQDQDGPPSLEHQRLAGVDAICASLPATRKVSVRVWKTFYERQSFARRE